LCYPNTEDKKCVSNFQPENLKGTTQFKELGRDGKVLTKWNIRVETRYKWMMLGVTAGSCKQENYEVSNLQRYDTI